MIEDRRVNTHNKNIKPWFDKDEWKCVYDLLFKEGTLVPSTEQTCQALLHLNVWKSRVDLLPSGIEGTIIILEALNRNETTYTDISIREVHGFTILRFLNVCVASRIKQGSFKAAAIAQNIPAWIIEIRNDISHDQKLPALVCLNAAIRVCFQWLKEYYWDAEYAAKKDFIPAAINTETVQSLMQIYFVVLTPDYDHEEVVNALTDLGVQAQLSRRNLKEIILGEIALSLPLPDENTKILCNIIINTFIKRYLADEGRIAAANSLDEIIKFLYDHSMLCTFVELLLNLNKRYYQDHVLCFYSKVLDRIFTSLRLLQTAKQQNPSLIQFKMPNTIKFATFYKLFELETFKPMPNIYNYTYMESFSKLLSHNSFTPLTLSIMAESISAHKLENHFYAKDVEPDFSKIFKKRNNSMRDVDLNKPGDAEGSVKKKGQIWSIVKDTSIFQKCALGDFPVEFLENAADSLYNHIK